MMRFQSLVGSLLLITVVGSASTLEAQSRNRKKTTRSTRTTSKTTSKPATPPAAPARSDSVLVVTSTSASGAILDERQLFLDGARAAWAFVERNYQAST